MTSRTLEFSFGEVGHDPPVHVVAGPWEGPAATSRAASRNVSLCGKNLSRVKKRQPESHELCRKCEDLMGQTAKPSTVAPIAEQDYEERWIRLGDLFVDREQKGLQRAEQTPWIKKIGKAFSWKQFNENPPKVSARSNGRYHIMDGQHEVAGARLAGYGEDFLVRVHVWRGLTYEQEAGIFVRSNRERHAVRALDLFFADVTSGQPDAAALDVLLNTYGWQAGSAGREGQFAAVTTLKQFYVKPGGPEVCDKVIGTITRAWKHDSHAAHRTVVKVLGLFYQKYPHAHVERLAQVLERNYSPATIHTWVHEKSWQRLGVVRLQERYDSGLRDPQKRLESPAG